MTTVKNVISGTKVDDFINIGPLPVPKLYGEALLAAAKRDPRIVCLTADLTTHTEVDLFRDELPDRFFQVGIGEANMIGLAGGMARMGDIPFAHTFSAFATKRCFDQVTMQVAYPRLPVKIIGFLPGVTTLLGVSHQAIEDIAMMRAVPNMVILEPAGPEYFASAVEAALNHEGPVYLRIKRPEKAFSEEIREETIKIGVANILRNGADAAIFATGIIVREALAAADELASQGIETCVVDCGSIKPLDKGTLLKVTAGVRAVVTAENHSIIGGLGSAVAELFAESGISKPFARVGLADCFAEGGSTAYLLRKYQLDSSAIAQRVSNCLTR
jgi:transketolase